MDEPHEPPCVRCRRESKHCHFTPTRRKRKADGEESEPGDHDSALDEYTANNRKKSFKPDHPVSNRQAGAHQGYQRVLNSDSLSATPPTHGYNLAGEGSFPQHDTYATSENIDSSDNGKDQEVSNDAAAALLQGPINIPGDALHLLLKASGESEDLQKRELDSHRRISTGQSTGGNRPLQRNYRITEPAAPHLPGAQGQVMDPAIEGGEGRIKVPKETLEVWSRLRFVRAGWFTAREGMSYVK